MPQSRKSQISLIDTPPFLIYSLLKQQFMDNLLLGDLIQLNADDEQHIHGDLIVNKFFYIVLLFLVSSIFQSCGRDANAVTVSPEIEYEILHESDHNEYGDYTSKAAIVIDSQIAYEKELVLRTSDLTTDVNFNEESILLIDMGVRGTGGPSINLISLVDNGDHIVATIELNVTPGGLQWVTNPYKFIKIKSTKEILFVEQLSTDS
ncbi:hypothetical protein [uncultured Paraglaciecola sp.]|uniref:hypothetical protein n=1 Tax=uncultured Paraglaciecola sp. TaxID=1765024 RepID=UPI002592D217|nr:hypothetical protein [uncultured Paraglaciecola sp.]